MKFIEFVCSGNHGRSVIAEALADIELARQGNRYYKARSSGTIVNELNFCRKRKNGFDENFARKLVTIGLERGMYDGAAKEIIGLNKLSKEQKKLIQQYASQALTLFEEEEAVYRIEALKISGIDVELKQFSEQTIVRPDSALILGMGQEHFDSVVKIYNAKEMSPRVDTLERYAGYEQTGFKGAFGRGLDNYIKMVRRMNFCVASAINRFLEE